MSVEIELGQLNCTGTTIMHCVGSQLTLGGLASQLAAWCLVTSVGALLGGVLEHLVLGQGLVPGVTSKLD